MIFLGAGAELTQQQPQLFVPMPDLPGMRGQHKGQKLCAVPSGDSWGNMLLQNVQMFAPEQWPAYFTKAKVVMSGISKTVSFDMTHGDQ